MIVCCSHATHEPERPRTSGPGGVPDTPSPVRTQDTYSARAPRRDFDSRIPSERRSFRRSEEIIPVGSFRLGLSPKGADNLSKETLVLLLDFFLAPQLGGIALGLGACLEAFLDDFARQVLGSRREPLEEEREECLELRPDRSIAPSGASSSRQSYATRIFSACSGGTTPASSFV